MTLPPLFFSVRLPTLLAKWWRWCAPGNREVAFRRRRKLSFVVFRLDALGDVVLTTPLFRELKRAFPDSRCTLVVQETYRSLFTTNPYIDQLLTLPAVRARYLPRQVTRLLSALGFWWIHLRGKRFDVAVSPRWDVDEHLATFLCLMTNAATRVGYTENTSATKQRLNRGFGDAFDLRLPAGPVRHEVLRNLAIVRTLGGVVLDTALDLRLTDRDHRHAARILATVRPGGVLIALGIGAQAAGRRWPLERYAQVIAKLNRQLNVRALIVCSEDERGTASELADLVKASSIIVSGQQLREACAVLERCRLFIGNDSGPAHLAAAMGCPTIVISKHPLSGDTNHPNSPVRFAPWCKEIHKRILQPAIALDNCLEGCRAPQAHCIKAVSVEEVVAAALGMLRKPLHVGADAADLPAGTEATVPAFVQEDYAARL